MENYGGPNVLIWKRLSMKIDDKVQVVDESISLLKQHTSIKGKIVKRDASTSG